jgi:hypothetical protein
MLGHNLNVADGLFNGARGTLTAIEWPNDQPPQTIANTGVLHGTRSTLHKLIEIKTQQVPQSILVKFCYRAGAGV